MMPANMKGKGDQGKGKGKGKVPLPPLARPKGKGKGKMQPPPPVRPKGKGKGPKGTDKTQPVVVHHTPVNHGPPQRAMAFPVEHMLLLDWETRRYIAAYHGSNAPYSQVERPWGTTRRLVDTMLPKSCALEDAIDGMELLATSRTAMANLDVSVHVDRLDGATLCYIVALDETCAALKMRIAKDLQMPSFMLILMLEDGPSQPAHNVPLSTYRAPEDNDIRLSLVVSLRDVCVLASHGDSEERAAIALSILANEVAQGDVQGDELVMDAVHECIGKSEWNSPLLYPALQILDKVLPSDVACTFFGACIGCLGQDGVRVVNVSAYAMSVLCRLYHTQGAPFISSCLQSRPDTFTSVGIGQIMLCVETLIWQTGRVHRTAPRAVLAASMTPSWDSLRTARIFPPFRAVANFENGIVSAALKLQDDAACYDQVTKDFPALHEALQEQLEVLGLALDDVLPHLLVTLEDHLGYSVHDQTDISNLRVVIRLADCAGAAWSASKTRSTFALRPPAESNNAALCQLSLMHNNSAEHVRLSLEKLQSVARAGDMEVIKVACLAADHADAGVRDQALGVLLSLAMIGDSDCLQDIRKILTSRHSPHADRIWREVSSTFHDQVSMTRTLE